MKIYVYYQHSRFFDADDDLPVEFNAELLEDIPDDPFEPFVSGGLVYEGSATREVLEEVEAIEWCTGVYCPDLEDLD